MLVFPIVQSWPNMRISVAKRFYYSKKQIVRNNLKPELCDRTIRLLYKITAYSMNDEASFKSLLRISLNTLNINLCVNTLICEISVTLDTGECVT